MFAKESGGVLQVIEKELQEKEAIEAEISAKTKSTRDNLKAHKSKHRLLQNSINDDVKAYISKKNQLDQVSHSIVAVSVYYLCFIIIVSNILDGKLIRLTAVGNGRGC